MNITNDLVLSAYSFMGFMLDLCIDLVLNVYCFKKDFPLLLAHLHSHNYIGPKLSFFSLVTSIELLNNIGHQCRNFCSFF